MKVRIITGLSATAVAIAALVFLQTPLMVILMVPVAAMASYEICHAAQIKNQGLIAAATLAGAVVPPLVAYPRVLELLPVPLPALLLGFFFLLVLMMLARFEKTTFAHVLFALLAGLAAPGGIAALLLIRDMVVKYNGALTILENKRLAAWFLFFTFCCAWLTDTFAYFSGVLLGRHKLCPRISPKKTVEGALGGLLLTAAANAGFAAMFNCFFLEQHKLHLLAVCLLSVPLCAVSMMGDLAASTLKRNFGVKDFGKLFPGHGGVMDRFDSLVFVAPAVYALMLIGERLGAPLFYHWI